MEPSTVADLIGLVLLAGVAATAVALFARRLRSILLAAALPVAAAVATGAMVGSLYFSEVADFVPCKLCWFQRIAMYPLAVLLVLATVWRDRRIFRYVVPIASIGFVISAYHVWIQWFPEQSNFCEFTNPCSAKWVDALGTLTIPQMAGLSFAVIIATGTLSLLTARTASRAPDEPDDRPDGEQNDACKESPPADISS